MKKALIFLFVLTIIFTLCACSSTEESDAQSLGESSTEESVDENSSTEQSVGEESVSEESSTDDDSDYNISYYYDEYSGNLKRITKTSKKIAEAKKSGTVDLTLEKLIDISVKKGSDISWRDFEEFISDDPVPLPERDFMYIPNGSPEEVPFN
jgi:DNA polymerase II small subunit/DNA polymerase delta subunit B